jgi:tRNA threonylcarbamoyladenosine biosynthesis protein TsaB
MVATSSGALAGRSPGGLVLAMDTAGPEGSVALARSAMSPGWGSGGELEQPSVPSPVPWETLAERILRPEDEHASLLVPSIMALLEEASAHRGWLSGIVVGAGPGSFTGVRVGAATAKGMAWALGIPLWAFSSLAAAAADLHGKPLPGESVQDQVRCVLFDARGDRLYAAAYGFGRGYPETLLEPRATSVGEALDGLIPPGALLLGDGAQRHRARFEEVGHRVLPYPAGRPTARGLLHLLALDPGRRPLDDPGRWEPCYLRESGAERMWKTRRRWKA